MSSSKPALKDSIDVGWPSIETATCVSKAGGSRNSVLEVAVVARDVDERRGRAEEIGGSAGVPLLSREAAEALVVMAKIVVLVRS